jgi:PAS domain S-box-containing protein
MRLTGNLCIKTEGIKYVYWVQGMHYTEIMSESIDSKDKSKKTSLIDPTGLSGLFQTINDTGYDVGSTACDFQAEREKFQIFIDSIPFGIVLVDKDGLHTYLNPKFSEMFGYTLEDIPDRETWFEKAYPEASYRSYVRLRWLDNIDFIKPEEKKALILNITCKDDSLKTIQLFPVQLKTGETLLLYEDFTELMSARKALQKSENKLRFLYEKSVDPILISDLDHYLDCNEAAVAIMHASAKEQLLKCGPLDISPERQPDGALSVEKGKLVLSESLKGGSSHFEWLHRNFDGEDFLVEVSLTKITFHDEKPFIYVVWRDITERKRAEEIIEHLSCFPRLNPNPILETDMEGNITFCNQATMGILHDFGVREDPGLFLPENIKDILSDFRHGKITQYSSEIEINGSRLDISIYYVERFGATHVYVNNITERKNIEKALKISEERYRNMFDSIPLPTMVYYLDTLSIIDINKAAMRHYGYSRDEFLKMTVKDLLPHEDVANLLKCSSKTDPSQARGLWRHKKKNGTIIYVEVTAHALQFADKHYRIAIIDDVTEARKAAEELQFTQFAVDRAAVGIIWIKEDAGILYVNDETCRSLGYSRKELLDMTIPDINPEYKEETWGKAWRNVKYLGSITVETLYKRKDAKIFPVELTGNYMEYDGRGYICAIVRNISERKKTEESLKKREEELQIESNRLEEANTALKVLLKHREDDKKEMEEKFLSNIKELVFPYVDKLKKSRLDSNQGAYLEIIEANMNDIISPFLQRMSLKYSNFTQTEIQVANLIKVGKTTKEIAELMKVSKGTIDTHRNNIRSKLGLNRKKINLRAYLLSIT